MRRLEGTSRGHPSFLQLQAHRVGAGCSGPSLVGLSAPRMDMAQLLCTMCNNTVRSCSKKAVLNISPDCPMFELVSVTSHHCAPHKSLTACPLYLLTRQQQTAVMPLLCFLFFRLRKPSSTYYMVSSSLVILMSAAVLAPVCQYQYRGAQNGPPCSRCSPINVE